MIISNGYGALKDKNFRIAHMGDLSRPTWKCCSPPWTATSTPDQTEKARRGRKNDKERVSARLPVGQQYPIRNPLTKGDHMFRILVSDKLGQAGLDRLDAAEDADYDLKTGLSKEELLAIIPEYDGLIIRSGTQVDATCCERARNLKVIGRAGMGVDNIDVRAATLAGVIVMNTPGANSVATAEQTMALMLAVSRHTAQAHASLQPGEWKRSSYRGHGIDGQDVGLVGFGRIGRLVAAACPGLRHGRHRLRSLCLRRDRRGTQRDPGRSRRSAG